MSTETTPGFEARGSLIDPQALMGIGNLELRARAVVQGFLTGLHRSPYHGFSVEFTEYRQYSVGDDPRFIDWRVLGRSDRYFIKKFEDETNLRCHFLVDQSRSMSFGSGGVTKAVYAATLAATLAHFLHLQGDAVGLMTFDGEVRDFLPARHRSGHLRHLMIALDRPSAGKSTSLTPPLRRIAELIRRRGMIVYLSDFLAPLDELERSLVTVTAGGHELVLFQVVDAAEMSLVFGEPSLFEDLESGRTLYVDPVAARAEYVRRFEAHQAGLRSLCQRLGVAFHTMSTRRPLELALFEFLQGRRDSKRQPLRRGPGA